MIFRAPRVSNFAPKSSITKGKDYKAADPDSIYVEGLDDANVSGSGVPATKGGSRPAALGFAARRGGWV